HRLLGPEAAVVIEGRDPLGNGYEVGRALLRHRLDEGDDRALCRAVVPRGQGIEGSPRGSSGQGGRHTAGKGPRRGPVKGGSQAHRASPYLVGSRGSDLPVPARLASGSIALVPGHSGRGSGEILLP